MLVAPSAALSQSAEEFFGKSRIVMYIGSAPGAGYDLYGRAVARHMGRHLPGNPTLVPSNMPGAGSIVLANFMYARAPRDGSALAGIQNGDVMEPIIGNSNARFKPSEFVWLGSVNKQTNVCISWATTGVKSVADVMTKEFLVGVVTSTSTETVANLVNELVGSKFKLIKGYQSTTAVLKAMEQGEVGGLCGIGIDSVQSSMSDALTNGRIHVFMQIGADRHPELPQASFVYDHLKDAGDKELLDFLMARMLFGRPFLAPPGVPLERAKLLQEAFWKTMSDPEFLSEASRLNMPVAPIDGNEVMASVVKLEKAQPKLVERATRIIGGPAVK
jgi:tripartite-type tricarboxylate transporter receptor subunit TctC